MVGRLEGVKNFSLAISAWQYVNSIYPEYHLNIYGEGPLKENLQKQIDSLGLQGFIHLRGITLRLNEIYTKNDFMIATSHYEGFSMVVLEGMASGLPIVISHIKGGINNLVIHKKNGLVVNNKSPLDLANAIIQLIENVEMREKMRKKSQKFSLQYDQKIVMKKWLKLFSEI